MAARRKLPTFFLLLAVALQSFVGECAKLSEPKILLPYFSTTPITYKIDIHESHGCFTWRSSRPEIATVSPISGTANACSLSVIVSPVSKSPNRMTTILLAENEATGEVLRCDVIIDSIEEIEIITTTRELYLEDSPEKFQIVARDSEGNTFSTLEGVAFEWSLISDRINGSEAIVDAHSIVRISTFGDSSYDTPPHIEVLEKKGLQGDTILVEGVKTGTAKVQAKLRDSAYKDVKPDLVRLIVIANVMLSPPDAYILLNSELQYRADLIKQGVRSEISLPSDQYHLMVENDTVCTLNRALSTVSGEALGSTNVVLRDKNMPPTLLNAIHQPTATVHVVLPAYIGFTVMPGRKWVLESGRKYEITIELYDQDSHKMHLSRNVRMLTEFVMKHFDVHQSTENGTHHVVTAIQKGKTEINAALNSVIKKDGTPYKITGIRGIQPLDIYDPLRVIPERLIFPWTPDQEMIFKSQIKAEGGSGDYSWQANDTSIAVINAKGQLTTENKLGMTTITASDVKNSAHQALAEVFVLPPERMEFREKYVEVEVGSPLDLPLAIYGNVHGASVAFTDCRQLQLAFSLENDVFVHDSHAELPIGDEQACTTIRLQAKRAGHVEVKASYNKGGVKMKAKIIVAAFDPLRPVDPAEYTVLALGSSREMLFHGGPAPWVVDSSQYFEKARVEDSKVVELLMQKASMGKHRLSVSCAELGEQTLTITVGNGVTTTNRFPAKRSANVRVYCKEPAGLQLHPMIASPIGLPACPVTAESGQPVPVHCYNDLRLLVIVSDDEGRPFDNVSSLHFDWHISDRKLAHFGNEETLTPTLKAMDNGAQQISWYQLLVPEGKPGQLTVSLTVNWKLTNDLVLHLVYDAQISPMETTIFNHPNNKLNLNVKGGSGYFLEEHTPADLARVLYKEQLREIEISPNKDGDLLVSVHDLCLTSDSRAVATVHLAGVHSVHLQVRDKVQIGDELLAAVKVQDRSSNFLLAEHFELMGLVPKMDARSRSYVRVTRIESTDPHTAMFAVRGVELGTARLSFTAQAQVNSVVISNAEDIQVFPPLRLEPRNVTLLVGAVIQLQAVGGPQPQSAIEWTLRTRDDSVAAVTGSGLVEAGAIGEATVTAQAVGIDLETGERIVYSQDTGEVHVVKLMGIRLLAPLTRLQTDSSMPLYAMGVNENETPFSFANVFPPLAYTWTITNSEVASLRSVYYQSDIELPSESRFSQQLHSHREGHVTVKLQVKVTQKGSGRAQQLLDNKVLTDEAHIQVFNALNLLSPMSCHGQVLITPNTEARLKTNRDSTARMSYKLKDAADSTLLTVSDQGEISSGSQTGTVAILITATEAFGANQTAIILVKIKPVRYVQLNCLTAFNTTRPLDFVPVGAALTYQVSHHDELGQTFDFTNSRLSFRPNRYDLLQVTSGSENDTVVVRASKISPYTWGGTALKVWDTRNARIADYVNMNVQSGIAGRSSYSVGDVFCLNSPFTERGSSGVWRFDGTAMKLDRSSGVGVAIAPGRGKATYTAGSLNTDRTFELTALSSLAMGQGSTSYLSLTGTNYVFPVMVNDQESTTCRGVVRPAADYPYSCLAELTDPADGIPSLFTATPVWDSETGVYGCKLAQNQLPVGISNKLATLQSTIKIQACNRNAALVSNTIVLTFLPPMVLVTKELYLSSSEPMAFIEIGATSESIKRMFIKIEPRLNSLLQVSAARQEDGRFLVPVKLVSIHTDTECAISAFDELAGVTYTLPVHITVGNFSAASRSSSRILQMIYGHSDLLIFTIIVCVVVTICCMLIGYTAVFSNKTLSKPPQQLFSNSPVSSVGAASLNNSGDIGSPWLKQRASPGRVALWSSGYEPQELNQSNISLFKKSPSGKMSPY